MKVAFCTHVSDDWYYSVGAHKLSQSLKYFHPEIDFYCFVIVGKKKTKTKRARQKTKRARQWQ